jgi:hypothetical protein
MKKLLIIAGLFFVFGGAVSAQDATTDLNIRLFGGIDIVLPTTPVLSAVAISPTQIDLTWSTSTDNFSLAGYRIFRSGEFVATTTIATTTQQFFSDSGLAPSTTLSYQVQAFDNSFNYSSTSNRVTVTTPNLPVVQTTNDNETTNSNAARVVIKDLKIETGLSTTSVGLRTVFPSRIEFRWGRSDLFELGYVVGSVFKREHNFFLDNLEPGTTYTYEIVGFTPFGNETLLVTNTFTTKEANDASLPANVNRFIAEGNGSNVNLSWLLPRETDINFVRIVRSHLDFPRFPTDGAVVYQGKGTEFFDEGILDVYSPVYYTAFLYDSFSNVSSGAVAIVYVADLAEGGNVIDGSSNNVSEVEMTDVATSSFNGERLQPNMKMPELTDILVYQRDKVYTMLDAPLSLDNKETVTIKIPVEKISGNLKSIIATIVDPTNNKQTYSFLLRINKDRSAYEAGFANLSVVGNSQLKIEIYDYEAFAVATYQTPIVFSEYIIVDRVVFPDIFFDYIKFILLGTVLFFTTILIFLLVRRR